LVEQRLQFAQREVACGLLWSAFRLRAFPLAPPGVVSFCFHGCAVSDSVEPAGQRPRFADGAGLPGQDQEAGLKSVFGILLVAEHAPADPQHQPPMPLDQGREGSHVTVA
jgi:hypothetical protein